MLKTIAYLTLTGLALVQGRGLDAGGLRAGSQKWTDPTTGKEWTPPTTGRGRGGGFVSDFVMPVIENDYEKKRKKCLYDCEHAYYPKGVFNKFKYGMCECGSAGRGR